MSPGTIIGSAPAPSSPSLIISSNLSMPPAIPLSQVSIFPGALLGSGRHVPLGLAGIGPVRVIAFAQNQIILAINHATNEAYTDAVPLSPSDRITAHLNVGYGFFGAGSLEFHAKAEVSNDGTNWVDSGVSVSTIIIPPGVLAATGAVNGAFLRFHYVFTAHSPDLCALCFDLHVLLDKS